MERNKKIFRLLCFMSEPSETAFIYDLDDCLIHYEHNKLTRATGYLIDKFINGSVSSLTGYLRDKYTRGDSYSVDEKADFVNSDPENSYVLTARPYLLKFAREETEEITSELGFPPENVIMFPGINLKGDLVSEPLGEPLVEKSMSGNFVDYLNSAFNSFSEYKEQILEEIREENEYERLYFFDNSEKTVNSLLTNDNFKVFKEIQECSY